MTANELPQLLLELFLGAMPLTHLSTTQINRIKEFFSVWRSDRVQGIKVSYQPTLKGIKSIATLEIVEYLLIEAGEFYGLLFHF